MTVSTVGTLLAEHSSVFVQRVCCNREWTQPRQSGLKRVFLSARQQLGGGPVLTPSPALVQPHSLAHHRIHGRPPIDRD